MSNWKVANLDKMEYLSPDSFGDGDKLNEHAIIKDAVYLLITAGESFAGDEGEFKPNTVIGHWAGDRVVVVSEDTEDGDIRGVHGAGSIYEKCIKRTAVYPWTTQRVSTGAKGEFKNISGWIREALEENQLYPRTKRVDLPPDVIHFNGVPYRK